MSTKINSSIRSGAILEQKSAPVFILTKENILLKEFSYYEIIGIKQTSRIVEKSRLSLLRQKHHLTFNSIERRINVR